MHTTQTTGSRARRVAPLLLTVVALVLAGAGVAIAGDGGTTPARADLTWSTRPATSGWWSEHQAHQSAGSALGGSPTTAPPTTASAAPTTSAPAGSTTTHPAGTPAPTTTKPTTKPPTTTTKPPTAPAPAVVPVGTGGAGWAP
ncbi:MAG TPA: hypothetical protein VGL60_14015, partial [Acidimicrobiales bacterium]